MLQIPILRSIEIKGDQEYFNTPDPMFNNGKKVYKHTSEIPLMYFVLYQMALRAQAATAASGQHYCHDCSSERRTPVHHFNKNYISDFMGKYKKALPILQKIQSEKLY